MTQPAAAPTAAWWCAKWPTTPPTMAPLMQPLASAEPAATAIIARAIASGFIGFPAAWLCRENPRGPRRLQPGSPPPTAGAPRCARELTRLVEPKAKLAAPSMVRGGRHASQTLEDGATLALAVQNRPVPGARWRRAAATGLDRSRRDHRAASIRQLRGGAHAASRRRRAEDLASRAPLGLAEVAADRPRRQDEERQANERRRDEGDERPAQALGAGDVGESVADHAGEHRPEAEAEQHDHQHIKRDRCRPETLAGEPLDQGIERPCAHPAGEPGKGAGCQRQRKVVRQIGDEAERDRRGVGEEDR